MARTDARSSAIMAAGTLVSRVLGFLKAILLTVALGALSTVGDVFETANTLPNLIYVLVAGGVFNAVLVPQIIKAAKAQDGGERYISQARDHYGDGHRADYSDYAGVRHPHY